MTFDVTYIEATSWGLLATVEVKTNIPSHSRLPNNTLLMDRCNIMRSVDREKLARRIDVLLPPPRSYGRQDWQHHLEYVATIINAELVRPVPLTDLSERALPQKQRFVIPGLLARGKASILYGPGGTGKSVLAARICGSVVTGLDLFGIEPDETGPVLYLDWEDDADVMVHRLEQVSVGMGLSNRFALSYKCLRGRGPYERHHADVKALVQDQGIGLVVFDSTAMAMHGMTADGAEGAIRFFDLINQLETTSLLIDHIASDDVKSGDGAAKPYGSVFKVNSARNMWEASRWLDLGLLLRHRKTNVGPRWDDIYVAVDWDAYQVTFERRH
jgi:hypothetical protein